MQGGGKRLHHRATSWAQPPVLPGAEPTAAAPQWALWDGTYLCWQPQKGLEPSCCLAVNLKRTTDRLWGDFVSGFFFVVHFLLFFFFYHQSLPLQHT